MLRIAATEYARLVAHCYDGLPLEACGLLIGPVGSGDVRRCCPTRNAAESSRVYRVDERDHFGVWREAEAAGLDIVGVFHSHTHTDPYPSPTDVEAAGDPRWHYVIVSLRDDAPMTRSYRIVDGAVHEEPVEVVDA
jgi:proteasome lid subunit RPN8/RPN11